MYRRWYPDQSNTVMAGTTAHMANVVTPYEREIPFTAYVWYVL